MDLGLATLTPQASLVAGAYTELVYTYTAGHPIDDSGYLKICFRNVGDFGAPQFMEATALNFTTVRTSGTCRLKARWDERGHLRPWTRALFIQITGGYLNCGESIIVVFGDRSMGSPGWQVQTFCADSFVFKTFVDPIASYSFKELSESPALPVIAGPTESGVCVAPSNVMLGQPFSYSLRLEDKWGNPSAEPLRFEHPGFDRPGLQIITVRHSNLNGSVCSNPIEVLPEASDLYHYWADFHGQSEETVGSNSIEKYFASARDFGMLDICSHQGNDFQVTDGFWDKINVTTNAFYEPGHFVTFPGYEWSGNTPLGGDRNVYYKSEGGIITRSSRELLPGQESQYKDSRTADELFRNLDGPSPFVFAHVGGRYASLEMHDEEIELAVEIHSAWGTFEWLAEDAFSRGYRIGICANSDGHKSRPGASYPGAGEFGSLGGLTCVLADRLDRENIYLALKARHFYATTGNRPLLMVRITTSDGRNAIMGDILEVGGASISLHIRFVPTAPIDRVEIRNGSKTVRTIRPYGKENLGSRIKIIWSGAEVPGRARATRWDGSLTLPRNQIRGFQPINFWNKFNPIRMEKPNSLTWESTTTGGLAGLLIDLEEPRTGNLIVETKQGTADCKLSEIGLEPLEWNFGGLNKRLEIYRTPDARSATSLETDYTIKELHGGDNPLYVCIHQEDGHIAWSSPIYLVE
jgi:Protein of unknown function (DUF3604)